MTIARRSHPTIRAASEWHGFNRHLPNWCKPMQAVTAAPTKTSPKHKTIKENFGALIPLDIPERVDSAWLNTGSAVRAMIDKRATHMAKRRIMSVTILC